MLGEVESKGDSSDRGNTPKKARKSSHKFPSKKKAERSTDFQAGLKSKGDKWAERFSRLEAMFLAKSFSVPVEPVQKGDVVVIDRPFIPPVQPVTSIAGQMQPSGERERQKDPQPVEAPGAVEVTGPMLATRPVEAPGAIEMIQTGQDASFHSAADRPEVQPRGPASKTSTSGLSEVQQLVPTALPSTAVRKSSSVVSGAATLEESVSEGGYVSDRAFRPADEGEVSDLESTGPDQEELLDADQELSAEQTYRETLYGIRFFMAWNDILEFDSVSSSQDDNPFAGSRMSHTGKVSVKVPVDDWLCRKFERLKQDQFIKLLKTLKWYGMHTDKKDFSRCKVHTWTNEPARLNSSFPRIANRSLPSAPASRPVSQDTLRKWEKAACDQTYMCNQVAAFSRCLTKVQDSMASQLKIIKSVTYKCKSASKLHEAADELDYLVTFNRSTTWISSGTGLNRILSWLSEQRHYT